MMTRRKTPLAALLALLLGASSLVAAAPGHAGPPDVRPGVGNEQLTDGEDPEELSPQNNGNRPDHAGQPGSGGAPADGADSSPEPGAEDGPDHLQAWSGIVSVRPDNDNATSCPSGTTYVKHNSKSSGTVHLTQFGDVIGASITVTVHGDGRYWDFQLNQGDGGDLVVLAAISKGGDDHAYYDFALDDGRVSATGLVSPLNRGGQIPGLSHASFCVASGDDTDGASDDGEDLSNDDDDSLGGDEGADNDGEQTGEDGTGSGDDDQDLNDDQDLIDDQDLNDDLEDTVVDDEQSQDGDLQDTDETLIRIDPQPMVLGIVLEPKAGITSACIEGTDELAVVVGLDNTGSTVEATYTVVVGTDTQDVMVAAGSTAEVPVVLTSADGAVTISVLGADATLATGSFDAGDCVPEVRGVVEVRDEVATEDDQAGEPEPQAQVRGVTVERTAATLPQTGVSAVLMALMGLLGMGLGGGLLASRRED